MELSQYWTLGKLARACDGVLLSGGADLPLQAVSTDTRSIKKGDFFWAIVGLKHNGNHFIQQAIERGAQGAVLNQIGEIKSLPKRFAMVQVKDTLQALGAFAHAHRRLFQDLKVTGITGSNGKTTTKEMLAAILAQSKPTFKSPGNFNTEVGCPLSLLELNKSHSFAVFELAAKKRGDIEYLTKLCEPQLALLTNIASAHLSTFGSLDEVWHTKMEIVSVLAKNGTVIYCAQDPYLARIPKMKLAQECIGYGFAPPSDVLGDILSITSDGMRLMVNVRGKKMGELELKLLGRAQALNALGALTAAHKLQIPFDVIKKALEAFEPVSMRGERVRLQLKHILIQDAYNANPQSMVESVASFMRAYQGWRKIIVLGAMHELGSQSVALHQQTVSWILNSLDTNSDALKPTLFTIIESSEERASSQALYEALARNLPKHFEILWTSKDNVSRVIEDKLASGDQSPCAILLKASRAEAFETISESLKAKEGL